MMIFRVSSPYSKCKLGYFLAHPVLNRRGPRLFQYIFRMFSRWEDPNSCIGLPGLLLLGRQFFEELVGVHWRIFRFSQKNRFQGL